MKTWFASGHANNKWAEKKGLSLLPAEGKRLNLYWGEIALMEVLSGNLYFVSDDFFKKVKDPYLKINYEKTKRPHYFAFHDNKTGLYWLVPCSSKVEKFERLIQYKQEKHKPTDTIKIVKVFGR